MQKKVKEKDVLIPGKVSEFVFPLLMELSSVRSERVICAFRDFLVWGYTKKKVCEVSGVTDKKRNYMKVTVFCFFVLSGFIPTNSNAKMNGYVEGSNLPGFLSAKTSDTAFLKQGDTVTIQITSPASSHYAGTFVLTSGDERCSLPSVRPYKYEVYKWPESIDMDNLELSLVEPNTLGIVTGTAPSVCSVYQQLKYRTDWAFAGNSMTATYRVSQIYRAGSASINTSVKVISGRSEYSQEEIISKLN
ncbi:adhesin biosynthesis transcription regulatory family protein, partial [Escherichia coli]|uniref:adhesin biosynthesis transcription regulatory family protein n=1 Tax=Escherichia coli TaxID=562 RepID=UPI00210DD2E4